MTVHPFARSLVRKGDRAIRIARLSLQNGDPDSAVNRAYYAMFNVARAALLHSGIAEGDLPRTHRGVNDAFRQRLVIPGRIDAALASALSRTENVRLMADYMATEIEPAAAAQIVQEAERFVQTVERVSGLEFPEAAASLGFEDPEERRRQAREDWLRLREKQLTGAAGKDSDMSATHTHESPPLGSDRDSSDVVDDGDE